MNKVIISLWLLSNISSMSGMSNTNKVVRGIDKAGDFVSNEFNVSGKRCKIISCSDLSNYQKEIQRVFEDPLHNTYDIRNLETLYKASHITQRVYKGKPSKLTFAVGVITGFVLCTYLSRNEVKRPNGSSSNYCC